MNMKYFNDNPEVVNSKSLTISRAILHAYVAYWINAIQVPKYGFIKLAFHKYETAEHTATL